MNIRLVKLSPAYKRHLTEMMEEWYATGEKIVPWAIRRHDYRDFDGYLSQFDLVETQDGRVPDSTFFCLDVERDIFVGAVNIRHYLNEELLASGGHIGDGIRPSERRKGYGTAMVALALKEAKKLGIQRVLMCCSADNLASAKTILNNGGVLENEILVNGCKEQRYWIDLA